MIFAMSSFKTCKVTLTATRSMREVFRKSFWFVYDEILSARTRRPMRNTRTHPTRSMSMMSLHRNLTAATNHRRTRHQLQPLRCTHLHLTTRMTVDGRMSITTTSCIPRPHRMIRVLLTIAIMPGDQHRQGQQQNGRTQNFKLLNSVRHRLQPVSVVVIENQCRFSTIRLSTSSRSTEFQSKSWMISG